LTEIATTSAGCPCLRLLMIRSAAALCLLFQAASTRIRLACEFPAFVIGPFLSRSPLERSVGTRPK